MKRVNSKEVFIANIIQPHGDKEPSIYYRNLGDTEPYQNEWLLLGVFLILFELKDIAFRSKNSPLARSDQRTRSSAEWDRKHERCNRNG